EENNSANFCVRYKLGGSPVSQGALAHIHLTNWISLTRGPDGIPGIARPIVFGFSFADGGTYLALCVVALWIVGFCVERLKHSKLGRAMQAVRDNELAAGSSL